MRRLAHVMPLGEMHRGAQTSRVFEIIVEGRVVATERMPGRQPGAWIDVDYPLPTVLTAGRKRVPLCISPRNGQPAGPIFGLRLFTARRSVPATIAALRTLSSLRRCDS